VNYLDKSSSTFFGILQEKMSGKGNLGNRKQWFEGSQTINLDAICGILVPNMPQITKQYAAYCHPK